MKTLALQIALWPFGRGGSNDTPIKQRFHAWWNGYDLHAKPRARSTPDEEGDDAPAPGPDQLELVTGWTGTRREVAEAVWNAGFVVPGGDAYVGELVSGCTLTAAETMLEINIGAGGGARTVIAKFGNYVTGYEQEQELAREARDQAVIHDIEGKLDVKVVPYEDIVIKPRYFRAALLRDALCMVEDKEKLLAKVCDGLKGGEAHLIITDFLIDPDKDTAALDEWLEGEGRAVYPWTLAELKTCLRKQGVTLRTEVDESDRYCEMVTEGWAKYLAAIRGKEVTEEVGRQAMAEAAYWTRRVSALKSGALRYYVIKAVRIG